MDGCVEASSDMTVAAILQLSFHTENCSRVRVRARACPRLCITVSHLFPKQLLWPTPRQQHYKSCFQTSKVCFITSPSRLTLVEVRLGLCGCLSGTSFLHSQVCGLPFNIFIPPFFFFFLLTSHQKQKGTRAHSLNQNLFPLLCIFYVSMFIPFIGV